MNNITKLSLPALLLSAAFAQAAEARGGSPTYNENWIVMDCSYSEENVQFETVSEIIPSRDRPKRLQFRVIPEIFDSFWRPHLIIEDGQEFPRGEKIEVVFPTHSGDTPAIVRNIRIHEDIDIFSFPQYEIEVQADAFHETFNNLSYGGLSPFGWVCERTPYADRETDSNNQNPNAGYGIR